MWPMQENPPPQRTAGKSKASSVRLAAAGNWAARQLELETVNLDPVSTDASNRRYFRIQTHAGPLILMDAPPALENSAPFVEIAGRLRNAGLHAPNILRFDLQQGFGLLEDLGEELYRQRLRPDTADQLLPGLFRVLSHMALAVDDSGLPRYDDQCLQAELDLFTDWYLARHRKHPLAAGERDIWNQLCATLKDSAAEQPQVFVHRDFHSCNLVYLHGEAPGLIDFQDAVRGPITYDFISLLWDRYIAWPRNRLESWMETYRVMLGLDIRPEKWRRWCDLMGLQRNLKIVGIFARLHYRDDKQGYLEMIPRFYQYLLDVVPRYPEFSNFQRLLEQTECAP